jgi:hypothetical protein
VTNTLCLQSSGREADEEEHAGALVVGLHGEAMCVWPEVTNGDLRYEAKELADALPTKPAAWAQRSRGQAWPAHDVAEQRIPRGLMTDAIERFKREQPATMVTWRRILESRPTGSVRPAGLPPQDPLLLKVGPGRTQARGIAAQKNKSKKSCLFLPVGI